MSTVTHIPFFLFLLGTLSDPRGEQCSLAAPSISSTAPGTLGLRPLKLHQLESGWLGLVSADGRIQFRCPSGQWSAVKRLPVDVTARSVSAGSGILLEGTVINADGSTILLVGIDGGIRAKWTLPNIPDHVHSLAIWRDEYWATVSAWWEDPPLNGLLELLPGGKVVQKEGVPPVARQGDITLPQGAMLYFGPAGERIFCVPHECHHDGPCHYSYCYRRDDVTWLEYGHWLDEVVPCGEYLLEQEFAVGQVDHFSYKNNGTLIRSISDGKKVAFARTGAASVIVCGGSDDFLIVDSTVRSISLKTGRTNWAVSIPRTLGRGVAAAPTGGCVVGLTSRDVFLVICPNESGRMVMTITK